MREGRDSTGDCPRDDKSSLRSHNRQETIWEHLLHAMMPFIRHSPAENGVPLDEYSDECDEPLARRATFDSRMLSQKIFRLKENGKDADRFSKRLKRNRSLEFAGENGATSHRNHLSRLAERIVNFRLPLGLLRRKSSKRRKREMSSNSSANLLSNALISPFLFVNHDENGEKMVSE